MIASLRLGVSRGAAAGQQVCIRGRWQGEVKHRTADLNAERQHGVDVAMGHFDRTLEFIDQLQHANTPASVCEKLLGITSEFGLTALMAGTVPQPGTPRGQQKDHVLLCEWPVEWLERYV